MFYSRSLSVSRQQFEAMSTTTKSRATPCSDGCYECLMVGPSLDTVVAQKAWPSLADLSTELLMLMFEQVRCEANLWTVKLYTNNICS